MQKQLRCCFSFSVSQLIFMRKSCILKNNLKTHRLSSDDDLVSGGNSQFFKGSGVAACCYMYMYIYNLLIEKNQRTNWNSLSANYSQSNEPLPSHTWYITLSTRCRKCTLHRCVPHLSLVCPHILDNKTCVDAVAPCVPEGCHHKPRIHLSRWSRS